MSNRVGILICAKFRGSIQNPPPYLCEVARPFKEMGVVTVKLNPILLSSEWQVFLSCYPHVLQYGPDPTCSCCSYGLTYLLLAGNEGTEKKVKMTLIGL